MAKSSRQKTKLLRLAQLLLTQTDEDHPITIPQIIQELAKYDISAERKSIYDDLDALSAFGLDIQSRKGKSPGWFIGAREFELPELKLLVDSVQSSRFLTRKKSDTLIRKLEHLASVHQAQQMQRQVYVSGRIKNMNESIYYNVDKLHNAIAKQRAITFRYFDYDMHRQKVYRKEGKRYNTSPYGLIWSGDFYYMVAYDADREQMRHYRVDKMTDIAVTCLSRQGGEQWSSFDIASYGQKHFAMFAGWEAQVTLRGTSAMAGVVMDRFGQDIILTPDGDDHFTVTLPLMVSPQFFGWLCGLQGDLNLVAPPRAVAEYQAHLEKVLSCVESN